MAAKIIPQPVPKVVFVRTVERTKFGLRVRWQSKRDSLHFPESFEVVATGQGVKLCGYSPLLQALDADRLADVLGQATSVAEMLKEGLSEEVVRMVLDTYEEEQKWAFRSK